MIPDKQRLSARPVRRYSTNSKVTRTYRRSSLKVSISEQLFSDTFQSESTSCSQHTESRSPATPPSSSAHSGPICDVKPFSVTVSRHQLLRKTLHQSNKARVPATSLTQLTLDLGQTVRTTCSGCGMSFCPSISVDAALHARFHAKHVGGVTFPGTVSKSLWESTATPHAFITVVDARSSAGDKRKAYEALKVVETELGAAELPEESLWGSKEGGDARFKVFLYVEQQTGVKMKHTYKVVGVILAERIRFAYTQTNVQDASVEMELAGRRVEAIMGIARVWTCVDARRRGVARRLIEEARRNFIYGMTVEKNQVAFSQPTANGSKLARAVLGDTHGLGWLVYKEEV